MPVRVVHDVSFAGHGKRDVGVSRRTPSEALRRETSGVYSKETYGDLASRIGRA